MNLRALFFCRVLEGDLTVPKAIAQARTILDPVERKYTIDILDAANDFLAGQTPANVGPFPAMSAFKANRSQAGPRVAPARNENKRKSEQTCANFAHPSS